MVDYRFPTRIKSFQPVVGPRPEFEPPEDDAELREIGGQRASFAEWVFALALWYLKVRFIYRWHIPETRFYVDFYIQSAPEWVMVDVRQFSSRETSNQRFRRKMIERKMMRPLHIIWDTDLSTFEEGVTVVRKLTY